MVRIWPPPGIGDRDAGGRRPSRERTSPMKRYLCWLTLLGVLAVPDWASACYLRQWFPPPPCQPMPPACYAPPAYAGPPVVYVPVYVQPSAAPRVQQVIPQAMVERDTP